MSCALFLSSSSLSSLILLLHFTKLQFTNGISSLTFVVFVVFFLIVFFLSSSSHNEYCSSNWFHWKTLSSHHRCCAFCIKEKKRNKERMQTFCNVLMFSKEFFVHFYCIKKIASSLYLNATIYVEQQQKLQHPIIAFTFILQIYFVVVVVSTNK